MVTPFEADLRLLSATEQLVTLKGCALCRITRDLDNGSIRSKDEWRTCRQEIGVPVTVFSMRGIPDELREATEGEPPVVLARTLDRLTLLLNKEALHRCNGKVADLRGRMHFRASAMGLRFPHLPSEWPCGF